MTKAGATAPGESHCCLANYRESRAMRLNCRGDNTAVCPRSDVLSTSGRRMTTRDCATQRLWSMPPSRARNKNRKAVPEGGPLSGPGIATRRRDSHGQATQCHVTVSGPNSGLISGPTKGAQRWCCVPVALETDVLEMCGRMGCDSPVIVRMRFRLQPDTHVKTTLYAGTPASKRLLEHNHGGDGQLALTLRGQLAEP